MWINAFVSNRGGIASVAVGLGASARRSRKRSPHQNIGPILTPTLPPLE